MGSVEDGRVMFTSRPGHEQNGAALPTPDTAIDRGRLELRAQRGDREARKILADWRAEHTNTNPKENTP